MEQFIYVLKVQRQGLLTEGPNAQEAAVLGEHLAYLEGLRDAGKAALFGRTLNNDADTFGLVILAAPDQPQALALMQADPAVAKNVMAAQLFPYRVAGFNPQALGAT